MTLPKFNDDLLLHTQDQAKAKLLYPGLLHLLDFPQLRAVFAGYDKSANSAKRRSRLMGYAAVAMACLGLMLASAAPLYEGWAHASWVAVAAAVLGLLGAVIGWFGVLQGPAKHAWIHNRLRTERLRQFHFQSLMLDLAGVARSLTSPTEGNKFQAERVRHLVALDQRLTKDTELDTVIDAGETDEPWIFGSPSQPSDEALQLLPATFWEAYEHLRLRHQLNYAQTMLRKPNSPFALGLRARARALSTISTVCVALLFALDMIATVAIPVHWHDFPEQFAHVVVVCLALVTLAMRTVEEGTQTKVEISRYQGYRNAIQNLLKRYATPDLRARYDVMVEMERLAYLEMKEFLAAHHEARFVM